MKYKNILVAFLFPVVVQSSTSLKDAVEDTLLHNPDILSFQKKNQASRLYIDEAKGDYLPTLDLELKYESENTKQKEYDKEDTDEGPKATLNLSQTLYNGNLTYNTILEKKYDYKKVYLESKQQTQDIVLEAIKAYLDLKQASDLISLSKENIEEHERILGIAKENEDISGEALDRLQAESKLYNALNNLKNQEQDYKEALSVYKKIVGNEPKEEVCKPVEFKQYLPKSLDDALVLSLQENLSIKAQLQDIFMKRAIISQEKSRFLPKIKANLKYEKDKDLTTDKVTSTVVTSSIVLSYNLFNGLKDSKSLERSKIFLYESQKKLDSTTKDTENSVKKAYNSYRITEKKIENLKKYLQTKKEILIIYQDQFEGGTVSILDLLGESGELFRARQDLIQEEIQQLKNYYEILALYGSLTDVVLDNSKQVCSKDKLESLFAFTKEDESSELNSELEDLLGEGSTLDSKVLVEEDSSSEETDVNESLEDFEEGQIKVAKTNDELVNEMLRKLLEEAYQNNEKDYLVVDDSEYKIQPRIIGNESFKDRFLKAPSHFYTINVIAFGSMEKASSFIKKNSMINNSFAFQYGKDLKLFKVVYGVFETYVQAKERLELLSFPEEYYPIIEKVGKKQELYKKYNINYRSPSQEVQEDELLDEVESEVVVYKPLPNNKAFENRFLNNSDKAFTINLYTFLSAKKAKGFIDKNKLQKDSFLFRFGKNKRLIKLVYGIYKTRKDASSDLKRLKKIGTDIYPVVEKLSNQKNIYDKFNGQVKRVIEEPKEEKIVVSKEFLKSSPRSYTINITTLTSLKKAKLFVDRYTLGDKAIIYNFGKDKKYSKIIYGIYKTRDEAMNAMSEINKKNLLNKTHIEKIKKHQELYKKYNKE